MLRPQPFRPVYFAASLAVKNPRNNGQHHAHLRKIANKITRLRPLYVIKHRQPTSEVYRDSVLYCIKNAQQMLYAPRVFDTGVRLEIVVSDSTCTFNGYHLVANESELACYALMSKDKLSGVE